MEEKRLGREGFGREERSWRGRRREVKVINEKITG